MAVRTFEVSFSLPILDYPTEGAPLPRDPNTDSGDGLFTSPGHYFEGGSSTEVNYSSIVDSVSSGAPSDTPIGTSFASIDNEAFRQNMAGLTLNAPSVRLRAKQTTQMLLPPIEQVAAATVSVKVVSRDSLPGVENVELDMAHGAPSALRGLLTMPPPAVVLTTRTALLTPDLAFGGRYELFATHLAGGFGEMQVFRSGDYPWGVHEISYIGLVITVETAEEASVSYRRNYPRHDSLAGGAGRNYPPSRAVQSSNRVGGGYP